MTAEQIVAAFRRKGYFLDDREMVPNIFGIRSESRRAGKFDDLVGVIWKLDGQWNINEWPATVDASPRYLTKPINKSGTAGLVPGQYLKVWEVDSHNGWVKTLCQRNGPVRVYRDGNRDLNLDYSDSTVQEGRFGINFHPMKGGSDNQSESHSTGSAGCQVFRFVKDHKAFMKFVYGHINRYGETFFSYALFDSKVAAQKVDEFSTKAEDKQLWATWIVNKEARRDSQGRIKVYRLPKNDGGGEFEIAGINDGYHRKEAFILRDLIEKGKHDEAEQLAKDFIMEYTSGVSDWHPDPRVQFVLRDCAFNRGPTGAAEIYQMALKSAGLSVKVDGKVTREVKTAGATLKAEDLVFRLLLARVERERRNRDESSSLWVGLMNRFVDCGKVALGLGDTNIFGEGT